MVRHTVRQFWGYLDPIERANAYEDAYTLDDDELEDEIATKTQGYTDFNDLRARDYLVILEDERERRLSAGT